MVGAGVVGEVGGGSPESISMWLVPVWWCAGGGGGGGPYLRVSACGWVPVWLGGGGGLPESISMWLVPVWWWWCGGGGGGGLT